MSMIWWISCWRQEAHLELGIGTTRMLPMVIHQSSFSSPSWWWSHRMIIFRKCAKSMVRSNSFKPEFHLQLVQLSRLIKLSVAPGSWEVHILLHHLEQVRDYLARPVVVYSRGLEGASRQQSPRQTSLMPQYAQLDNQRSVVQQQWRMLAPCCTRILHVAWPMQLHRWQRTQE